MPTYNASAVSDTAIAFQKPITLQQGRALRDNALSVFEGDASAPLSLLPTVHLGTITTTTGTTQTLTGLDLSPFRGLRIVWVSVLGTSGAGFNVTVGGVSVATTNAVPCRGIVTYDLQNGIYGGSVIGSAAAAVAGLSTITTATTSISATTSGTSFTGGSVRVYGLK